jgi:hypothetical protein
MNPLTALTPDAAQTAGVRASEPSADLLSRTGGFCVVSNSGGSGLRCNSRPLVRHPDRAGPRKTRLNRLRVGSSQIDALDALFVWQDTAALIHPTH